MAGFLILYSEGRLNAAAALLALATMIKMFPAALALIPLLRRDLRWLVYFAGWGMILGFGLPLLFLGPQATFDLHHALWTERLAGIFTGAFNPKTVEELSPWAPDLVN